MKLTGYTNAYNSLTNFEFEVNELTGNGNYVNLLKLAGKKNREITSSQLFFGGFEPFETTAASPPYFSLIQ